jgi:hypothetical protein
LNGLCTGANNLQIDCKQLLEKKDFVHPLLSRNPLKGTNNVFHYQYDDLKGLLDSAINVYATLIHSENPHDCQFKINPSPLFCNQVQPKNVHFSIKKNSPATETVTIRQLETIVGDLSDIAFQYSDKTIIDDSFDVSELPDEIDGDELCCSDEFIVGMLKNHVHLNRLEIRYINPVMGFGVYSRDVIKNGEVIGVYTGIKQVKSTKPVTHSYIFSSQSDSLNMHVDARQYGNITRFINHAFDSDKPGFSNANVSARNYKLHGVEFIIYSAQQDIPKGVQLLVNYGEQYFKKRRSLRFKNNRKGIDLTGLYSSKKAGAIRVMADHGVKHAQLWLFLRILIISGLVLLAVLCLQVVNVLEF